MARKKESAPPQGECAMRHGSTWLSSERPARGLTLKRTNTVGVLMPEFDSPFYGPILDGVHSALARSGYQMLVSCVGQNITRKVTYVQLLRERKIDGALILTPREVDVEPIRALADDRFPVVLIDGMIDAPINEPAVIAVLGHISGEMSPGHNDVREGLLVAHHLLLAHGLAIRAFRQSSGRQRVAGDDDAQTVDGIGIALSINQQEPATDDERDVSAAKRVDGFWNSLYLEPLFNGHYPEDILEWLARAGVLPVTAMGWEVYPEGLFDVLKRVSDDYTKIPLFITENGAAFEDALPPNGSAIDDAARIDYLSSHFEAVRRLCECGVNLRGYYVWSLMDNFEWAQGYSKRFGLVHVDFQTQQRTAKRSALWYRDFIRSQR